MHAVVAGSYCNYSDRMEEEEEDADLNEDEGNDDLSLAGFRMMEKFGLVEKEYSTIPGVSLEPGSFNSFPCYRLHRDALVSQPTK